MDDNSQSYLQFVFKFRNFQYFCKVANRARSLAIGFTQNLRIKLKKDRFYYYYQIFGVNQLSPQKSWAYREIPGNLGFSIKT